MTTIKLERLDFFSHHGVYEEERKVGNRYTVDVEVSIDQTVFSDNDLDQTVNYEEIYLLVTGVMSVPTKLLETIASSINQGLFEKFSIIASSVTTVSKHNPPIKGICKQASVTIKEER